MRACPKLDSSSRERLPRGISYSEIARDFSERTAGASEQIKDEVRRGDSIKRQSIARIVNPKHHRYLAYFSARSSGSPTKAAKRAAPKQRTPKKLSATYTPAPLQTIGGGPVRGPPAPPRRWPPPEPPAPGFLPVGAGA